MTAKDPNVLTLADMQAALDAIRDAPVPMFRPPPVTLWAPATLAMMERAADLERARTEDFERTRIKPGADPRAQWDEDESFRKLPDGTRAPWYNGSHEHLSAPWRARSRRVFVEWHQGAGVIVAAWDYLGRQADKINRRREVYVPFDVVRWRRADHRAEMKRRAREYAQGPGAPR